MLSLLSISKHWIVELWIVEVPITAASPETVLIHRMCKVPL